jgi:integrase
MSRRSKGPRLWLRPARRDVDGNLTHESAWLIIEGTSQHSTRLGIGASEQEKDEALKAYLAHKTAPLTGSRDPSQIEIADVLAKYVTDKNRSYETQLRIKALRKFWGARKLSEVNGNTCRAYIATRTEGAARRELEDFRAAINHHRREGLHDKIVSVVLPAKSKPREDYLTREEASSLIWHAWRYREKQNLRATDRATRKHVARFMVVARWMGSRAGVICEASIEPRRPEDRAWINLKTGMFHGTPTSRDETKKRRQLIHVPTELLAHMRRWQKNGQRYVVEWNGHPVLKVRKAHDACVAACEGVLGRHVSLHIWRHTVATWVMQNGGDPFEIAGHLAMTQETLLRVYGHHHPQHSAKAHAALRKKRAA